MSKDELKKEDDTPPPPRRRSEVMASDDLPPMPVETLQEVEYVAWVLLDSYRRAVEWEQEACRVLDACKENPETGAGRELRTLMILSAWRCVGDLLPGNELCQALPASGSIISDAKGPLWQAQALHKHLSRTGINLSHAAKRLLPDVWERLEILPVEPPAKDLDAAERDWKRLVKASGAERARRERGEKTRDGKAELLPPDRTPENDPGLIYQADAATFYNIPKSVLSKAAKKKPGEPGYLWSGRGRKGKEKRTRVWHRKKDLEKIARSRKAFSRTSNPLKKLDTKVSRRVSDKKNLDALLAEYDAPDTDSED